MRQKSPTLPPPRKVSLRHSRDPIAVLEKDITSVTAMAYLLVADRKLTYPGGRSKIAYIGKTDVGIARGLNTAVTHAGVVFSRGVRRVSIFPIRVGTGRATALDLERGLLNAFEERYGRLPLANTNGGMRTDHIFTNTALASVLDDFD